MISNEETESNNEREDSNRVYAKNPQERSEERRVGKECLE